MRHCLLGTSVAFALALGGCGSAGSSQPVTRTIAAAPTRIQTAVRVGIGPVGVAVGAGAVWVANGGDGTVTRIDPATRAAGPPIATGRGPVAIAAGDSGVWVANASGTVVHIDPATRRPTGSPAAVVDPAGIAVGSGVVWVTSRRTDSVIRIDPTSGRQVGAPIRVGSQPTDIAVAGGRVWVADSADGTVANVDAASGRPGSAIRVAKGALPSIGVRGRSHEQPGAQVLSLAAGDSGVWVAKTDRPEADRIEVVHIDASSRGLSGRPIEVTGGVPMRVAVSPGAVWVTDVGTILPGPGARSPALLRIDPRAGARAGPPVPIGAEPTGLAAEPGGVWVSTAGDNRVSEATVSR